jgi:hypothetical protein
MQSTSGETAEVKFLRIKVHQFFKMAIVSLIYFTDTVSIFIKYASNENGYDSTITLLIDLY